MGAAGSVEGTVGSTVGTAEADAVVEGRVTLVEVSTVRFCAFSPVSMPFKFSSISESVTTCTFSGFCSSVCMSSSVSTPASSSFSDFSAISPDFSFSFSAFSACSASNLAFSFFSSSSFLNFSSASLKILNSSSFACLSHSSFIFSNLLFSFNSCCFFFKSSSFLL